MIKILEGSKDYLKSISHTEWRALHRVQ